LKQHESGHKDEYPFAFEDMSDEEREDFQIKPTDALIVAAKIVTSTLNHRKMNTHH